MKLICISDTHGKHEQTGLQFGDPHGDVVVCAGDISSVGGEEEVREFCEWFADLPIEHKVLVAGNHDFYFARFHIIAMGMCDALGITYLEDSGATIDGVKFWGSPWTPWFNDWAFNAQRGKEIKQHWDLIPDDTDVLVTHGPPYGCLDRPNAPWLPSHGASLGCEELAKAVLRVKPKLHVFGHIHSGRESPSIESETIFVNASICTERYQATNNPTEVKID